MAVDVRSSSEPFISPRISFSHDLNNQSYERTTISSTSAAITATFDFCITPNINMPPITSADELFLDGVLLPTEIKKPKSENEVMDVHRKRLKELLSENDNKQEKSSSRSFWKFTRTTSLNSGNGTGPKRLFRSLSLKRLLHSNPTLNPRGNEDTIKVIKESNSSRKEPLVSSSCFSSVHIDPPVTSGCNGNDSRRWSLPKKDSGGGIQINPVLNIPPAYNMHMFGYGSLFCKGKPKSKNK